MRHEELKLNHLSADTVGLLLDELAALYDSDFVEPDVKQANAEFYSRKRFFDRMTNYASREGFDVVEARLGEELVGFVTAANLGPDTQWWAVVSPPLAEHVGRETGQRTVAVFDLLVARPHRGKGYSSKIHAELLRDRTEERATLLSAPTRQPAHTIWQH